MLAKYRFQNYKYRFHNTNQAFTKGNYCLGVPWALFSIVLLINCQKLSNKRCEFQFYGGRVKFDCRENGVHALENTSGDKFRKKKDRSGTNISPTGLVYTSKGR